MTRSAPVDVFDPAEPTLKSVKRRIGNEPKTVYHEWMALDQARPAIIGCDNTRAGIIVAIKRVKKTEQNNGNPTPYHRTTALFSNDRASPVVVGMALSCGTGIESGTGADAGTASVSVTGTGAGAGAVTVTVTACRAGMDFNYVNVIEILLSVCGFVRDRAP